MSGPAVPAFLLVLGAAAAVLAGGIEGAGVIALAGAFLVAFTVLLFRRATVETRGLRERRAQGDRNFLWTVVLVAMLARVAVALALRFTGANEAIAPDEFTFHDNGQLFAMWLAGDAPQPFGYKWADSTQVGYFAVVGSLYGVFGDYPIVPVLLNCAVGSLCAVPAYLLGAQVAGRPAGRGAALLVSFFPSLVLWSSLLIRDAFVLFFLLWNAHLAQSLLRRFRLSTLAWLLVCLAALATLRSYLFVIVAAGTVLSFVVASVRRPGRAVAAALASAAGVAVLMKVAGLGTDYLSDASLRAIALQRQWSGVVGSGAIALEGYDLTTPTGALTYLPVGLAWFLLSPFPWQVAGRQGYAVPEVLVWYACIPLVLRGMLHGVRHRRRAALVPMFVAVLITLLYALVEGNVGIIFRHRAQVLALFLPFAAVGWALRRRRARPDRLRGRAPLPRRPAAAPRG